MSQVAAVEKVAERRFKGTPGQIRRRRIELSAGVILGSLLMVWIVANIIQSPTQFAQVFILGVRNGLLYALIALGYTLVYGIIELINLVISSCWARSLLRISSPSGLARKLQISRAGSLS